MAVNECVQLVAVVTTCYKEEYVLIFLEDICYALNCMLPKFIC